VVVRQAERQAGARHIPATPSYRLQTGSVTVLLPAQGCRVSRLHRRFMGVTPPPQVNAPRRHHWHPVLECPPVMCNIHPTFVSHTRQTHRFV